MFLLVASALGASIVGWPCQRLNWGWRNVWSTCSIHSFAPTNTPETPAQAATGFRVYGGTGPVLPQNNLNAGGIYQPPTVSALPQFFCTNAAATGTGFTSTLRNRCRRALDAYGSLVRMCNAPAAPQFRQANAVSPDHAPAAGHQPHMTNVGALTTNAQLCLLPPATATPNNIATPSNTCPGLLGWFTVVFNACGFSNAPGMAPNAIAPNTVPNYFPISPNQPNVATAGFTQAVVPNGVVVPSSTVGYFCKAPNVDAVISATNWNAAGVPGAAGGGFRTSRCRKALDQFGRTAVRCHNSLGVTGPANAGGFSDPLRLLALGAPNSATPNGLIWLAAQCN